MSCAFRSVRNDFPIDDQRGGGVVARMNTKNAHRRGRVARVEFGLAPINGGKLGRSTGSKYLVFALPQSGPGRQGTALPD
ncbi:MAG: hypothetical protein GY723_02705 [bacterium]|nr:hypothetical protein [bacterium]